MPSLCIPIVPIAHCFPAMRDKSAQPRACLTGPTRGSGFGFASPGFAGFQGPAAVLKQRGICHPASALSPRLNVLAGRLGLSWLSGLSSQAVSTNGFQPCWSVLWLQVAFRDGELWRSNEIVCCCCLRVMLVVVRSLCHR
jgi:hypothetical protein